MNDDELVASREMFDAGQGKFVDSGTTMLYLPDPIRR